ncbi:MAG: methyltransferase domain-containing protein [Thermodesulfobacteriota bacterium]
MGGSAWLDMEGAIKDQLALQVDLSFDRHHAFLLAHGLEQCRHVFDLGTGNGLFLARLARAHPAVFFHGIDDKPHMIAAARGRNAPNAEWVLADALAPGVCELLRDAGAILMRYFLLHLPNTRDALCRILARTKPGTRLWAFDLDVDHSKCEPPHEAFTAFTDLVKRFCEKNAVEIRTFAKLPPILEDLGWEVDCVSVEPFNNREVDAEKFARYLLREAALYHYFLHGTPGDEALRPLRDFLHDVMDRAGFWVQYGMVMVSAVKRGGLSGCRRSYLQNKRERLLRGRRTNPF